VLECSLLELGAIEFSACQATTLIEDGEEVE
jgi:hypothetical protein